MFGTTTTLRTPLYFVIVTSPLYIVYENSSPMLLDEDDEPLEDELLDDEDEDDCDDHVDLDVGDDRFDGLLSLLSLLAVLELLAELLLDRVLLLDADEAELTVVCVEGDDADDWLEDEDDWLDDEELDELEWLDADDVDWLDAEDDSELCELCDDDSMGANAVGSTLQTLPDRTARLGEPVPVETDSLGTEASAGETMIVPVTACPTTPSPNELDATTMADRGNGSSDGLSMDGSHVAILFAPTGTPTPTSPRMDVTGTPHVPPPSALMATTTVAGSISLGLE